MNAQVTADQIANELRQGYDSGGGVAANNALFPHLAETIDVWHEPRVELDGPWPKALVVKARETEVAAFSKMIEDYHETGRIDTEGSDVIQDIVLSGKFKGEPINLTLPCRWTVENGEITRMGSYITEDSPKIQEIMMASGLMEEFLGVMDKLQNK